MTQTDAKVFLLMSGGVTRAKARATVWFWVVVVGGRKKENSHGDGETGRSKEDSLSVARLSGGVLDCFAGARNDGIGRVLIPRLSAPINEVFLLLFVHKKKILPSYAASVVVASSPSVSASRSSRRVTDSPAKTPLPSASSRVRRVPRARRVPERSWAVPAERV